MTNDEARQLIHSMAERAKYLASTHAHVDRELIDQINQIIAMTRKSKWINTQSAQPHTPRNCWSRF